jgi:biopolymer transport protein ExbB/TolQ
LEIPAIIILILAVVVTLFQLGGVIVEYFVERRGKRPDVPRVLEDIAGKAPEEMADILKAGRFQGRQEDLFLRLLRSTAGVGEERKLLAIQLLSQEEARLNRRIAITDIIARIGPMFGLMATLIPLGPGLIALGRGDTHALADSLLTAFDATVAGLAAAGVAFIISKVRKRWYQADLATVETILEGVVL